MSAGSKVRVFHGAPIPDDDPSDFHACLSRSRKAGCLFGIIPASIVELCRRWIAMPGGLLHVLQLRAVLKRGGDEGRAHRLPTCDDQDKLSTHGLATPARPRERARPGIQACRPGISFDDHTFTARSLGQALAFAEGFDRGQSGDRSPSCCPRAGARPNRYHSSGGLDHRYESTDLHAGPHDNRNEQDAGHHNY
jgi:hypothetical protein